MQVKRKENEEKELVAAHKKLEENWKKYEAAQKAYAAAVLISRDPAAVLFSSNPASRFSSQFFAERCGMAAPLSIRSDSGVAIRIVTTC